MQSIKLLATVLFSVLISNIGAAKQLESSAYDQKFVPLSEPQVVQKYKEFAQEFVQNQPFSQNELIVLNPFAVGQSLAVVNENVVLNVSSSGIEDVVKIGCHKITPAYQRLMKLLSKDKNTKISSTIYTQQEDVYLAPGLGKLNTYVNLVDMTQHGKSYIEFINSEIERKLTNKISSSFFPTSLPAAELAGEYLVNIFEYDGSWTKKWEPLNSNPAFFYSLNQSVNHPYIVTSGNYETIEQNNMILVKLPLADGKKNLILVKSNVNIVHYLKPIKNPEDWPQAIDKLWNDFVAVSAAEPNSWTRKHVTIQVPILKQMIGSSIAERLRQMGLTKTVCTNPSAMTNSPTNFIEQFGQLSSIELNENHFALTSITGVKNIGQPSQVGPVNEHSKTQRNRPDSKDESASKQIPVGEPVETVNIIFDQPFFWSLEDSTVGPIFAGGVMLPNNEEKLPEEYMKPFLICGQ